MEAGVRTLRELLEGKEHYEIPVFQRPYVWNEEDQWAPLWDDVRLVADGFVGELQGAPRTSTPHHFLGAVVYMSHAPGAGGVVRRDVIDGQQRMTTLQVLAKATRDVLRARGYEDEEESLTGLIHNHQTRFKGTNERFKLWPLPTDRAAFKRVMDDEVPRDGDTHSLQDAYWFFRSEVERWLENGPSAEGDPPVGNEAQRALALASVIEDRLLMVAIDLTGEDDPQLIFESLNDRGTPLLRADLVKNWVFTRGKECGADVERWAEHFWADFDGEWWREEITVGRSRRSRIDVFLQYWLTMRTATEVKTELVFNAFKDYAGEAMGAPVTAEQLLMALESDAQTYKELADLSADTPGGQFYSRVIGSMELAVTTPALLWLLSRNHHVPSDQVAECLSALESWVVRRTLLRATSKDINRFMVAILKKFNETDPAEVGTELRWYLSEQTAETRIWPSDASVKANFPNARIYYSIKQARIKAVLRAVEQHLLQSSRMHEQVMVPTALDVEHIMPRRWRTYWDTTPPLDMEAASKRDWRLDTVGNLTLVTTSLNSSLSNRPWMDGSPDALREGGHPGKGKRTLLSASSVLLLNKRVVDGSTTEWTEEDIERRGAWITGVICEVWPGPDDAVQLASIEQSREN